MSNNLKSDEKVIYVGDSRVVKKTQNIIPRDYSAYPGKSEAFVPNFLLKEWMVGAVVVVGFMALIIAHPSPLGYPADPLNTGFIPMPDWYFLFLYQLLKYPYMADNFIVFGTVIMPGLLFGALTIAPFLDTGKERRFYRRPIASGLMFLSIIAVIHLTYVSWSHYQHELEVQNIVPEHIERAQLLAEGKELPAGPNDEVEAIPIVEANSEGFQLYEKSTCIVCHATDLAGSPPGIPALLGVGDRFSKDEIMEIVVKGKGGMMPQYQDNLDKGLSEQDIETLVKWLSIQKEAEPEAS